MRCARCGKHKPDVSQRPSPVGFHPLCDNCFEAAWR